MATIATASIVSSTPAETSARLAARIIDFLLLGATGAVFGQLSGFGYVWLIATGALVLAYFALADTLAGATLGKVAMRIRVVGDGGNRPSIGQSLAREVFTVLGAIPFAGPFLALGAWVWIVVTIRSSPIRQGVHDRLSRTRVVRRDHG